VHEPILLALGKNADIRTTHSELKIYVLGVSALLGTAPNPIVPEATMKILAVKVVYAINQMIARLRHAAPQDTNGVKTRSNPTLEALIHKGGYASDEDAETTLSEEYDHVLHDLHATDGFDDDDDKDYYSRIDSIDELGVFLQTVHGTSIHCFIDVLTCYIM
jgi:hypothetical protein